MLEARGVTVRYGGRVVVDDVDLSAKPGEVLSIAGPNGAGKSTLLAVLSRSVVPCAGTVQIDRTDINLLHPVALARRRAVLEQTPIRDLPFSVVELVEMSIPLTRCPGVRRIVPILRVQWRNFALPATWAKATTF